MELIVDGGEEAPKIDNDWGCRQPSLGWLVGWLACYLRKNDEVSVQYSNTKFQFNDGVANLVRLQREYRHLEVKMN